MPTYKVNSTGQHIIADELFMKRNFPNNFMIIEESPTIPVIPQVDAPVWEWYIDLGSFFDRFESAKLPILSSTDLVVKAIIADVQVRKWIDLKLPSVAESLAYISTKVPELTPELQTKIITTKPTSEENLILRKSYFS